MTTFGTVVLLFLMSADPQSAGRPSSNSQPASSSQPVSNNQPALTTQSSSFCECLGVDAAVNGLTQLRAAQWRGFDRTGITKLWPGVPHLPCQPSSSSAEQPSLGAAAEHLARCCETCELCGGVAFAEPETSAAPDLVDIWLARGTFEATNKILQALASAAFPTGSEPTNARPTGGKPGAKPTSASHSKSRIIDGYSWDADGARFQMRADAIAGGDVWLGHFQIGRCTPREPVMKAKALDAKAAAAKAADAKAVDAKPVEAAVGDTVLSLSCMTTCLFEDGACWKPELDRLWPKLRSQAAGRTIASIDIDLEDCFGSSVSFEVTRLKDGRWSGGLWRPATP